MADAVIDYCENLTAFLERCRKLKLTLHSHKFKLLLSEVHLVGHLQTAYEHGPCQ